MTVGALSLAAAVALLAGCQDPQPSKQELVNKGNWYYWRAEYVEAIGPYTKAADRDPADAEVLYKIGQCHFNLHNYRESIKWYRQALKSFPGHAGAAAGLEEAQRRLPSLAPPPPPETGPEPAATTPSPRVTAESYINIA
ncbi:MAG: tetratricopeptide repeat protein, partial [Phycisphaerae bacterium]|nr:tetratricopeptide repeat protein [Phycisphaerae bacterium]